MQLRVVEPGPEREAFLPLLLLADESEQQVRWYPDGIEENGIPLRDMVWLDQEL